MIYLRELTAASLVFGPFVDDTDGKTAETALVLNQNAIRLSKNGGAFAGKNASDTAVHKENGYYGCNLSVTDLNTPGSLQVCASTSGALPVWMDIVVLASPVYDSLILGSDKLQIDVRQWNDSNIATPDTAGYPKVTVKSGTGTGEISLSSGAVTVGTNNDKTGYSLTQSFPSNFASFVIDASGRIQVQSGTSTGQVDLSSGKVALQSAQQVQLNTQGKADVNAEVVDALNVDTYAELSSLPGASPTLKQILMFLYMIARNKVTTTSSQRKVYLDDGSTVLGTWGVSDDGSTFTQAEIA